MITIDGRKMGKSYNNVIKLSELFSGSHEILTQAYSPMTVRFFILQTHYRSTLDFSNEALQAAEKGLRRIWEAFTQLNKFVIAENNISAGDPDLEQKCFEVLSALDDDIDFLIVDMAAGISPEVLAFMAACSRRFVVVRDDPSSIADAYATIKVLIQDHGLDEIYLVPNGVGSAQEGYQLFERINQVCARFLNRTIRYLGSIENDELILSALKKYQPVSEFAPGSAGARDFRRLAEAVRQLEPIDEASGGLQFFVERLVKTSA